MESKAIEQLLQKYLEAETSLEEEAQLKAYFSSGEVAPHLQEYVPLFAYFGASKEEHYAGITTFPKARKKVYSWVAVAASIVILGGVFLQESSSVSEFGSYEDPEIAMQKTKEALNMVSKMMNAGKDDLGYLREFDKTKNKILK